MHCGQKEKGQAMRRCFLSRYMPEHDDGRDEGDCMNIEQMANAFQFRRIFRLAHLQRVNRPLREVPVTHIFSWVESIFSPLYENEVGKRQWNSGAVERMTERKTKAQKKRHDGLKGSKSRKRER